MSDHARDNKVRGSVEKSQQRASEARVKKYSLTDKSAGLLRGERHSSVEWRQNPSEWVDQFISSLVVKAEQLFRGHVELLGVRVHAFPHGSEDHLKVYLERGRKRQNYPVVYFGRRRPEHETLSIVGLLQIKSVVMSRGPPRIKQCSRSLVISLAASILIVFPFEASRVTLASTSFHDGPPFADVRKHFVLRSILGQMEQMPQDSEAMHLVKVIFDVLTDP